MKWHLGGYVVDLVKIPIEQLREHPYGLTVMKPRTFSKLVKHIEATGWYEPLTVRHAAPSTERTTYQVINGHSRLRALRWLRTPTALCLVSEMDDQEGFTTARNPRSPPWRRCA